MKNIILIVLLLLCATIATYSQPSIKTLLEKKYKLGDKIVVDDTLTLVVMSEDHLFLEDAETIGREFDNNLDWVTDMVKTDSAIIPMLPYGKEITQKVLDIFYRYLDRKDRDFLAVNIEKLFDGGAAFDFLYLCDKNGKLVRLSMSMYLDSPMGELDPQKIGRIYKAIYKEMVFPLIDTGLTYYYYGFRVTINNLLYNELTIGARRVLE